MPRNSKIIVSQIVIAIAMLVGIIWYIGVSDVLDVLLNLDIKYLIYASIGYLVMNILFAIRLHFVLKSLGYKVNLSQLLMIQYGGMLASDFTPARSGYFSVPVMLTSERVPLTVGFSTILGIQSVEFLIKMLGGFLALLYLVTMVTLSSSLFVLSVLGVVLMGIGTLIIFLAMWWNKAVDLIKFFERFPFIGKIAKLMSNKILEFQNEGKNIRKVVLPIIVLTCITWIVKGVEWYYIGLAVNITQISFIGYFLLHPLITALSFVPITPSGIGFQEGGIVGIFFLLGVPTDLGIVFALLARFLLVIQDMVGIIPLSRAGVKIYEGLTSISKTNTKLN
jgi:uncharacterized protein (TIRG00374 family)